MWLQNVIFCCLLAIAFISAGEVGDNCLGNKEYGVCVLIEDCEVAVRSIVTRNFHQLMRCGFEGTSEIVCCPDTSQLQGGKKLRAAERECNKIVETFLPPIETHIIDGEIVNTGDFPHMVALGYRISGLYVFRCGGSLISDRYVLTAMHCLNTVDRIEPSMVRLGVVNITSNIRNDTTDIEIERNIFYPEYVRPRKYHDLALIRLTKRVKFSNNVLPVCLYTKETDPTIPLSVTGWGRTDVTKSATSNLLLKATLSVVPRENCNLNYAVSRKLPNGIINKQICAGDLIGNMDTCQGDSGGPLQGLTESDGHYRLVGVTSFGNNCGTKIPGVYTRVAMYLDWIEEIVWPTN